MYLQRARQPRDRLWVAESQRPNRVTARFFGAFAPQRERIPTVSIDGAAWRMLSSWISRSNKLACGGARQGGRLWTRGGSVFQVPGEPLPACPALRPRRDLTDRPFSTARCCLPCVEPPRLPRQTGFEDPSRSPQARCLRLIPPITRRNPRLASGWRPALSGRGCLPAGFQCTFSR